MVKILTFIAWLICCVSLHAASNILFPDDSEDGQWLQDDSSTDNAFDEKILPDADTEASTENSFIQHQELTRFGNSEIIIKRNSVGAGLGMESIKGRYFLQIRPELNLHFGKFAASIGAPLRFPLFDVDRNSDGTLFAKTVPILDTLSMRRQDWDEPNDFLRFLRYVSWGERGEKLFADIGRTDPITLGQGSLVRVFAPNLNVDQDSIFAQAKGDFGYVGVEGFVGPFLVPHFFGASLIARPLNGMTDKILRTLGLSLDYVGDIQAPTSVISEKNSAGSPLLAVSPTEKIGARYGAIHGGTVGFTATPLIVEMAELDTYTNYSHLWFPPVNDGLVNINSGGFSDGGLTVGTLFKMSLGATEWTASGLPTLPLHAFRFRLEGNLYGSQFLPNYFDSFYQMQKYEFGVGGELPNRINLPTKIGYLARQRDNGIRLGFYAEASYALMEWFSLGILYADAVNTRTLERDVAGRNFAFHIESTEISYFQMLATYQLRNFDNFGQLFNFQHANELIFLAARVKILPFLFINGWLQRTFYLGSVSTDNKTLRVSSQGEAPYRFSSVGIDNAWVFGTDVELALQF